MDRYVTRRAFAFSVAVALAGCSGDGTGDGSGDGDATDGTPATSPTPENPATGDVRQRSDLTLSSPAFEEGGEIPDEYGHDEDNVNPPLSIGNRPEQTASLTLVVDDPDAVDPAGKVWLHWLVWNIPPSQTDIPEGWEPSEAVQGRNDFDNHRYDGPAPPDEQHTYRFKLYALEETLDLPESASKGEVGESMRGSVLAQTQLEATYAP